MTLNSTIVFFFRYITLLGMIFTGARLLHFGLHRKYRVFFAYLLFSACRSGVLLALDVRSGAYMKFWIVSQPVLWVFYVLLVLELYSLILDSHRGLYTLGRWAMYGALALALISSLISLAPPANDPLRQSEWIAFYALVARGLLFSLVVFLALIMLFLSRYPVVLNRNVIVHSLVYSVFFLSSSLAFLLRSMFGYQMTHSSNTLLTGISAACVLAWSFFLTAEGERRACRLRPALSGAGQERHLIQQLDALNATLLRAARK